MDYPEILEKVLDKPSGRTNNKIILFYFYINGAGCSYSYYSKIEIDIVTFILFEKLRFYENRTVIYQIYV